MLHMMLVLYKCNHHVHLLLSKFRYKHFLVQSPTSLVINWVVGDGQNYNSSSTITKPSTAGVQSIVQYSAKGATSALNATG